MILPHLLLQFTGLTLQVASQEKVHLLDTFAVPSYDKADEYLTRCEHRHSQRVTWFELTVSMVRFQYSDCLGTHPHVYFEGAGTLQRSDLAAAGWCIDGALLVLF